MGRRGPGSTMKQHILLLLLHTLPRGSRYLRSALQMWVTRERPMAPGSMRYWDVSTMALTPPSTGTLSCSTERELSRQAPRGRSVRQRLRHSSRHCLPTTGSHSGDPTEPRKGGGDGAGAEGCRAVSCELFGSTLASY